MANKNSFTAVSHLIHCYIIISTSLRQKKIGTGRYRTNRWKMLITGGSRRAAKRDDVGDGGGVCATHFA